MKVALTFIAALEKEGEVTLYIPEKTLNIEFGSPIKLIDAHKGAPMPVLVLKAGESTTAITISSQAYQKICETGVAKLNSLHAVPVPYLMEHGAIEFVPAP